MAIVNRGEGKAYHQLYELAVGQTFAYELGEGELQRKHLH
jgi:hypothetical protein